MKQALFGLKGLFLVLFFLIFYNLSYSQTPARTKAIQTVSDSIPNNNTRIITPSKVRYTLYRILDAVKDSADIIQIINLQKNMPNGVAGLDGAGKVLTSQLPAENDPTVASHIKAILTSDITNWNTAFGWGNHASAGYLLPVLSTPTEGQFLRYISGAWRNSSFAGGGSESTTAVNGLNLVGTDVRLGGDLIQETSITGGFGLTLANRLFAANVDDTVHLSINGCPDCYIRLDGNGTVISSADATSVLGHMTVSGKTTLGTSAPTLMARVSSEPLSATNGDFYYNTTFNRFRKYENGSWADLDTHFGNTNITFSGDRLHDANFNDLEISNIGLFRTTSTGVSPLAGRTQNVRFYSNATGLGGSNLISVNVRNAANTADTLSTSISQELAKTAITTFNNGTGEVNFIQVGSNTAESTPQGLILNSANISLNKQTRLIIKTDSIMVGGLRSASTADSVFAVGFWNHSTKTGEVIKVPANGFGANISNSTLNTNADYVHNWRGFNWTIDSIGLISMLLRKQHAGLNKRLSIFGDGGLFPFNISHIIRKVDNTADSVFNGVLWQYDDKVVLSSLQNTSSGSKQAYLSVSQGGLNSTIDVFADSLRLKVIPAATADSIAGFGPFNPNTGTNRLIKIPTPQGEILTAINGLTKSGTQLKLGGTLTENTTITSSSGAHRVTIDGVGASGGYLFAVTSTADGAILGSAPGIAISGTSAGVGVNGVSTASGDGSAAVRGTETGGGVSILGNATTGKSFLFNKAGSTDNTVISNGVFRRVTSAVAGVNGIGQSLDFEAEVSDGSNPVSNQFISKWTNVTLGSRTSEFSITGVNNATTNTILTLMGSGQGKLNMYGSGIFTGTVAKYLAVTSTGDIIESDGSGGGTVNLGYTASATNGIITNSGGDDATFPIVDETNAGLMSPEMLEIISKSYYIVNGESTTAADSIAMYPDDSTTLLRQVHGVGTNGLTGTTTRNAESITHTFKLGGTLTENTTIAVGTNQLDLTGSRAFASGYTFGVTNTTGSVGVAIKGMSADGRGVWGNATSGAGLYGSATSGYGVFASATTGNGLLAQSLSGALSIEAITNPSSTNTVAPQISLLRSTSGTAANGIGQSIDFYTETTTGASPNSARLSVLYSDATNATVTSSFNIKLLNSGTLADRLTVAGTGQVQLHNYGSGTFTGTPAKYLAVTSTGLIIESDGTGGGGGGSISDAAFGAGWDANTTDGASKNALYDKIITLASLTGSETLTNKTLTTPVISSITNTGTLTLPTVTGTLVQYSESSITSSATPTPTGDARENYLTITALATNAAFAAPSGTAVHNNWLTIEVKDDGTSRTLSWDAVYKQGDIALPTNTVVNKVMVLHFKRSTTISGNGWLYIGQTGNF